MLNWDNPDSITTPDLVEIVSWKGSGDPDTEDVAKKSAEILFYRFGPSLIKHVEKLCIKNKRDLADALTIAQRSIRKFVHSGTFSFEKSLLKNPESAVKAYLNKVAYHEFVNLQREEKRLKSNPYTGNETLIFEMNQLEVLSSGVEPVGKLKKYLELVDHVLSNVDNQEHRMIFLTYLDAGIEPGNRAPKHLKDLLIGATGLSWVTIKGVANNIRNRIKPIWDVYSKEK